MNESSRPLSQQRLLGIFAHPDDEVFCMGGTLAKYNAIGIYSKIISATRGEAGQIHDIKRATRDNLGDVRRGELRQSCQTLGVEEMECWDYPDGALSTANRPELIQRVTDAILAFRPDMIVTFGPDGAYGHPDHITIGEVTTLAFQILQRKHPQQWQATRLYYATFPQRQNLLLNELVTWLTTQRERFHGSLDFVHGLTLFAQESTMLHYSSDFVEVRWFSPGFCIIEQGEVANDLYVILSGTVEVIAEDGKGHSHHRADLTVGDFFGETGIASSAPRNAHVIAKDSVTCLAFSPGEPSNFLGRGQDASLVDAYEFKSADVETHSATHAIDVQDFIHEKISAVAAHHTQYPIEPDMFPEPMLKAIFGIEYFTCVYPKPELKTVL